MRVLIATLVLLGFTLSAHAKKRVALVIGNSSYNLISPLANPKNDAELMASTLKDVGFEVVKAIDVDYVGMRKAVQTFGRSLRRAGKDAVGLLYYAGHGVQARGANYLIPLNADIQSTADLDIAAVSASQILSQMEEAGNRLNLIILDACRNNPFKGSIRSAGRGLTRIQAASGSLIAFAAAPGQVAADGNGKNSPYTSALVESITTPGLPVELMFKRVRTKVEALTGGAQTPWEESSLKGDFSFVPGGGSIPSSITNLPAGTPPDREAMFWNSIADGGNIAAFEEFLRQFPEGTFAGLAKIRIDELKTKVAVGVFSEEPTKPNDGEDTFGKLCDKEAGDEKDFHFRGQATFLLIVIVDEAISACEKAVEGNPQEPRYAYQLARAHRSAYRYQQYFDILKPVADANYPAAVTALGEAYMRGYGVAIDKRTGIELLKNAARLGDPVAMEMLAVVHEKGNGAAQSIRASREWHSKAFKAYQKLGDDGWSYGVFKVGRYYDLATGNAVPENKPKSVELYRKAFELGHVESAWFLGYSYDRGEGVSQDKAESKYWFRKDFDRFLDAADRGDGYAMYQVAKAYHFGDTLTKSRTKSQEMYRQIEQSNDAFALGSSASNYGLGIYGLPKNIRKKTALHLRSVQIQGCTSFWVVGLASRMQNGFTELSSPQRAARCVLKYLHSSGVPISDFNYSNLFKKISPKTRREMQRILKEKGFYRGTIDGQFGAGTRRALDAFALSA